MKKYLAIFLSFIIIFSAALVCVQVYAADSSDTVVYTESTISGDKSEIEGIHVDLSLTCDEHLFWNVGCTMGENESYDVKFEHYYDKQRYTNDPTPSFDISFGFTSWGGSSNTDMLDKEDDLFGQYDMIADVASRTPAGETRKEVVHLSDYYDYYPISFSMHINDSLCHDSNQYSVNNNAKYGEMFTAIHKKLSEYFKIPIIDELREIEVTKRSDGAVVDINSSPVSDKDGLMVNTVDVYSPSIVSDSAIYFILAPNDTRFDMSEMGDGYGIYRIPYEVTDYEGSYYSSVDTYTNVKIDELSLVYPLEVGVTVEDIAFSSDMSEIFLTTRHSGEAEDEIRLTVIDVSTMTDEQSTVLFTCASDDGVMVHSYHDDFILYRIDWEKFAVVEKSDGLWQTAFTVDDESVSDLWSSSEYVIAYYDTTAAYDGERLVIAGYSNERGGNGMESAESYLTSFYLSVYSANGNLYTGKFTSSLDTGTFLAYNETCRPTDGSVIGIVLP